MKAFAGRKCSLCKAAIPEGTDIHYDAASKTVQHWDCHESQPPDPADYDKAESLGFRDYDELMKENS